MSAIEKIPRKIFPILVVLVVFAGALGIAAIFGNWSTGAGLPAAAEVETLLSKGSADTGKGYFEATSTTPVAAAAGQGRFRQCHY
jgi:hypothetical protein